MHRTCCMLTVETMAILYFKHACITLSRRCRASQGPVDNFAVLQLLDHTGNSMLLL